MSSTLRSLGLTLAVGMGALLPHAAHAQVGVEPVKLGYQDTTGRGTLIVVPLEQPRNSTDPAPYRAQFTLEKGGVSITGAGITQYLPASQNHLLAFAISVEGRIRFYEGRTATDAKKTGIVGGGSFFPMEHPEQVQPWDIVVSATESGGGTGGGTGETPENKQAEQLMLLLNQYRKANNLPALTRVKALDDTAAWIATDMAKLGALSTKGSDGSTVADRLTRQGYPWRTAGEVVGMTTTLSAETLLASLTRDAGTKQYLLSPTFTECGLAVAAGANSRYYWCIDLASR